MAEGIDIKALATILEGLQKQLNHTIEETVQIKQRINELGNTATTHEPTFIPIPSSSQTTGISTQVIHAVSPIIPLAPPERFSGDPNKAQIFLTQCSLHFLCRPVIFSEDQSKVAFILSYLTGDAAAWSMPIISRDDPVLYNFHNFKEEFLRIFDRRTAAQATDNELLEIKQGNKDLVAYLAHFNKLIVETAWPESKRAAIFYRGLRDELKDALAQIPNRPTEISELIDLVLQIDHRLTERRAEKRRDYRPLPPRFDRVKNDHTRTGEDAMVAEPMQIGSIRGPLSKEEKEKRRVNQLCLYCGLSGHFVKNCPKKPKTLQSGKGQLHQ